MTQFTALDKHTHRLTRILTGHGAQYGENIHLVPVVIEELMHLILEYPVCLIKDNDTGQFGLQALLGFELGENLFLQGEQWQARYVPLHIKRQPFMVAVNAKTGEQPTPENTVITINNNNNRVQEKQGELIFDKDGNITPFMQNMNNLLSSLVSGIIQTEEFIKTLLAHNLIEAIQLTVNITGDSEQRFDGIYTVNEQALKALNGETLVTLNKKGYLQACYMLLASMGQVQKLVAMKREKHKK